LKKLVVMAILVLIFVVSLMSVVTTGQKISDQNVPKYSSFENMQLKIVVLRDDDVYKVDPGLEWLSKFVIDNNLRITYAVIPAEISSAPYTINYLNWIYNQNNFELATHGYYHTAFKGLPYDAQYSLIDNATKLMKQYFGGRIYTFIPPFESADLNTTKACRDLGYHSISGDAIKESYITNFVRDFAWENFSIPNMPDYEVPHSSFSDFISSFDTFYNSSDEIYVIGMHHATWYNKSGGLNKTLTKTFENTIDYMKSKNVEFMTMEQAYEWCAAKSEKVPLLENSFR
jgi:peptidoglycan/xylan/chitin deacetylase (PgdA/CDA1 family)